MPRIHSWIEAIWISVGVFWAISAIGLKPTARRQKLSDRVSSLIPVILAAFLLFGAWRRFDLLNRTVLPENAAFEWAGLVVTAAGAALAIYARARLGTYWSGTPAIKEGHKLICTGPYAIVRHPIYSGLLLSVVGTAIAFGEVRHFLAIFLTWTAWTGKISEEERLLTEELGDEYAAYRLQVKSSIIPYIW